MQTLSSPDQRAYSKDTDRQRSGDVLCQQTRGSTITFPMRRGSAVLELVHTEQRKHNSIVLTWHRQCDCRLPQQTVSHGSRVGSKDRRSICHIPEMGYSTGRPICNIRQQEMSPILLESGARQELSRRCVSDQVEESTSVCVSSHAAYLQNTRENQVRGSNGHFPSSSMAQTSLVSILTQDVNSTTLPSSSPSGSPHSGRGDTVTPQAAVAASDGVASYWLKGDENLCSEEVKTVLLHSRKQSTRNTYLAKWRRFSDWCIQNNIHPLSSPLQNVLDYILDLRESGLTLSSLRVHLAAISAFHQPVGGSALFSHAITKRFLKGLQNLYPPRSAPSPSWNLDLVLDTIMHPPFEPLASVSLHILTMKTIFLLAITSARRVGELGALMASPPFTVFSKDTVTLRLHPDFIPKVCSSFHINEPIVLPTFYPKPHSSSRDALFHTLDFRRALSFYIDRTRQWRRTDRLLVSLAPRSKGKALSTQRIAKLITLCIMECHSIRNKPLPSLPRAHSTRAVATSTAFARGVPLADICRAATWASSITFARHYAITKRWASDAAVASAVLSTVENN
nr:uncharacterized protein LOC112543511 [Pelodiscus sinensis]|eukprot:XP_025033567.1 uncharacterized protein LOC112543511 [Pelodiscus sinensis]